MQMADRGCADEAVSAFSPDGPRTHVTARQSVASRLPAAPPLVQCAAAVALHEISPHAVVDPTSVCCVCLDHTSVLSARPTAATMIELACGHAICSRCSTAASEHGHARCPLCRAPHNLAVAELRQRLAAYRGDYQSWRAGGAAGAKGELAHIVQTTDADVSTLDSHAAAAGILAMPSAAPACTPAPAPAGERCIFTYWHVTPASPHLPEVTLRCIESMRVHNPGWRTVVVTPANLRDWLSEDDWPEGCTFELATREVGDIRRKNTTPVKVDGCTSGSFFESVQKLSNWVRMTLLYKYGGVWLDASIFCTAPVETWVSPHGKLTLFNQRLNPNVLENWALAAPPHHWLVGEWRAEMARAHASTKYGTTPLEYISNVFATNDIVRERWGKFKGVPYLWCHLTLQVVLSRFGDEASSALQVNNSADGPTARRQLHSQCGTMKDDYRVSELVAEDLALRPLDLSGTDRFFIKLIGPDRAPVQARLVAGEYVEGSALWTLAQLKARPIDAAPPCAHGL
jgi:hypothetical protein